MNMNIRPEHFRQVRDYYALNQTQAAHLIGVTKQQWAAWENGREEIPAWACPHLKNRLQWLLKRLTNDYKFCYKCGKKVEAARSHGGKACPYCSAHLHRSMKKRVNDIIEP